MAQGPISAVRLPLIRSQAIPKRTGKRLLDTRLRSNATPKCRHCSDFLCTDLWLKACVLCEGCTVVGCVAQAMGLVLGELGVGEHRLHLHQVVAHGGARADGIVGAQGRVNRAMLVERGILAAHQAGALAELMEERGEHAGP